MKKNWYSVIAAIIVLLLVMPVVSVSANEEEASAAGFVDVPSGHWALAQIEQAVEKGYVSGFPDGTFKPEEKVSRAQFIRMLVDALKLPHVEQGEPWYQPYVAAVIETGIHREKDFDSSYDKSLSRLEMVKLAVRATDAQYQGGNAQEKTEDQNFMVYRGAQQGILAGVGAGNLDLDGTSTRAQAVAIIERILSVGKGKKLPVDKYAVAAAELAWHRTNLFSVVDVFMRDPMGNPNLGVSSWKLENLKLENDRFSAELDELIAINLGDPNDPNRKLLPAFDKLQTMPFRGAPVPKDGYVLIGKYHVNYNKEPKIYTGAVNADIRGYYQPDPMVFDKIIVPWNLKSLDPKYAWMNENIPDKDGKGAFVVLLPGSGYKLQGDISVSITIYASGYPGSPFDSYINSRIAAN